MPPMNPLRLPSLETDHLIIRDFAPDDFETVHRILDLEGAFGDGDSRSDRQNWFDWSLRNYAAFASLYQPPWGDRAVTLRETGEVIGVVGYTTMFHPLTEKPSLSFSVISSVVGTISSKSFFNPLSHNDQSMSSDRGEIPAS